MYFTLPSPLRFTYIASSFVASAKVKADDAARAKITSTDNTFFFIRFFLSNFSVSTSSPGSTTSTMNADIAAPLPSMAPIWLTMPLLEMNPNISPAIIRIDAGVSIEAVVSLTLSITESLADIVLLFTLYVDVSRIP